MIIRNSSLRTDAWLAGGLWLFIVVFLLIVPSIANGKPWGLAMAVPQLAVVTACFRIASTSIRYNGVLTIRNPFRTVKLRRSDVAAIEVGRLHPKRRRGKDLPYVETAEGERVLLYAAVRVLPGLKVDREKADEAVRRLREWWGT